MSSVVNKELCSLQTVLHLYATRGPTYLFQIDIDADIKRNTVCCDLSILDSYIGMHHFSMSQTLPKSSKTTLVICLFLKVSYLHFPQILLVARTNSMKTFKNEDSDLELDFVFNGEPVLRTELWVDVFPETRVAENAGCHFLKQAGAFLGY